MPALLAVLAVFMAGMALGAWGISAIPLKRPALVYARLEIAIGIWAVITAFLIPAANRLALQWIGLEPSPLRHWLVAFLLPCFVLLPATAAMGATLPVIERFVTPLSVAGRSVAALYAANTLGAVLGILAGTFIVLPRIGLRTTLFLFAAINVACGLLAFALSRVSERPPHAQSPASRPEPVSSDRLWTTLFITGLLGIGYEVVGVRILAQVLENTVYTYAAVLAVFLLGTSLGAAIYHRFVLRTQLATLLALTALACLAGILAGTEAHGLYQSLRMRLGAGVGAVLLAEMAVSAAVFLLPTMAMGATFSHLAQLARETPRGLGRAVAVNTLGAAVAPLLFSILLLPSLGGKWTWLIIPLAYLLLLPRVSGWRWAAVLALPAAAVLLPAHIRFVNVPAGGRLLDFKEGVMASVAVVEDATAHKSLRVDNRFQMGGTGVADAEYRHAHLPLLLHPSPARALFLGLGTGITMAAAGLHTNVVADGVELVPEVLEVMPHFTPFNDALRANQRLRVFVADARRFARVATNTYDVIVGDLFHPARDGAGSLYTVEHFQSIRQRLAPGGLFCQWLPLHQLDHATLRVITRTFLEVFPDASAWMLRFNVEAPVIGLIGATASIPYSPQWLETRAESPLLRERLQRLALNDSLRFFGNLLAGPAQLRALAGNARVNTDDNSAVLFAAARFASLDSEPPYGRLTRFLEVSPANPAATLGFGSPELDRFVLARNVFLRGLIAEADGDIELACDRYIESARLSADFTAGYAKIVHLATAESKANPARSRALLERLIKAQPGRPVAKELLQRLFPR